MATATQIATRALRRLRVTGADETPSASDVAAMTEGLEALINSWEASGLTNDTLPLDARFEQAVVAMLAVRMADEFGKTPSQVLFRDADAGERQIMGAFFPVPQSTFESALQHTGHYANFDFIINNQAEDYSDWQANTAYTLRRHVENNGLIYECITAGNSDDSGGPTGTEAEITDGTVTWCFRRVAGA